MHMHMHVLPPPPIRLWHIEEEDCLRSFTHPDMVTCVQFQPYCVHHCVTGCMDGRVRIWSVLDGTVLAAAVVHQVGRLSRGKGVGCTR